MNHMRLGLTLGAITLLATSAHAISFGTTAVVNGTSYTLGAAPGLNGVGVQQIGDTISFALPIGIAINTSKTITLEYSVFADSGFKLSKVTDIASNGIATGSSSVSFSTLFQEGFISETTPTTVYNVGSSFPPSAYSFTNQLPQWTTVRTTLNLSGVGGLAKVSTMSANYEQTPVPEPMTMGVLATGLVGIVMRRRGKK